MTCQELEAYNDAMMHAAHDEYLTWLAEQASCEDPDDPTDSDVTVLTGILTPVEIFWTTEAELYRQDQAALRADLYAF